MFRDDPELFPPEPFCRRAAWAWIVHHAWKSDVLVTVRDLAATWRWPPAKTQRFLSLLQKRGMIEIATHRHLGSMIHLSDTQKSEAAPYQNGQIEKIDTPDDDTPVVDLIPNFLSAAKWVSRQTGRPFDEMKKWIFKLARKYEGGMILDALRAAKQQERRDVIAWTQFEINKRLGANGHDRKPTAAEQRLEADRKATLAAVLAREARHRTGNGGGA